MEIRRRDLIIQLEDHITDAKKYNLKEEELRSIKNCLNVLNKDEMGDQNGLVISSHGVCNREGAYAPIDGNGKIDFRRYVRLKKGDPIPEESNWFQIGSPS